MKALVFDGTLKLLNDAPAPSRNDEALVQVINAGICNTDLEIVKGYAGFQGILGHEFVGRVVESPRGELIGRRVVGEINVGCGKCALCLEGDPRHCASRTVLGIKGRDGSFAEFLSLPVRNLIEIPDSISDEAAVFVEPLAAAFNILEHVDLKESTEVVIIGDGKLAQLVALVLSETGCMLTMVGKHDQKLELARRHVARCVLADAAQAGEWQSRFDVAIEASGSPSGINVALRLVKPRGTVVLKSTYQDTAPLSLSQIVVNEVTIVGSRCGRFQQAINFLAAGRLDLGSMVSRRFPIEDGLIAMEAAASPETMKVILQMS